VAALGALELAMRLLPVREPLEAQPVTASNPYLHFSPNRDVLFSAGWNFEIVNRVHVNNYGFVNDQDYDRHAGTPLLAVIGDSYVEATQVPYRQSMHGRLAAYTGSRARVYSFASSGSPLSQYLGYAQFARDEFRPQALVIAIIGNDFDESLVEYTSAPGFHYFRQTANGDFTLELVPFSPSMLHRALRKSALARHIHGNGRITAAKRRVDGLFGGSAPAYVGNVSAEVDASRLKKSQAAVDYFLDALPRRSGIAPDRIVFVVDGMRPHLYDPRTLEEAEASYFGLMREHFMKAADARGYLVADLQPRFLARHARDGIRFEWDIDSHWNAYGHEEAAAAVVATGIAQKLFTSTPAQAPGVSAGRDASEQP
jgi:hypothetical protein